MLDELARVRAFCDIGIVGGSDLSKQMEQLGPNSEYFSIALVHCPAPT